MELQLHHFFISSLFLKSNPSFLQPMLLPQLQISSMPNINYDLQLVFHGSFYISFADKQEILKYRKAVRLQCKVSSNHNLFICY